MTVKCVDNIRHKEVPVYIFKIEGAPDLPDGFYYTAGVFYDDLDPGEAALFNPHLTGVFQDALGAKNKATQQIDNVERMLDREEEIFEFVEE